MSLQTCHECGNQVSSEAKTCPKCGAPVRRKRHIGIFGGFFIFLLVSTIVMAIIGNSRGHEAKAEQAGTVTDANCDPIKAYIYSTEYVEKMLKAPGSAKFAEYADSRVNRLTGHFERGPDGKVVSVPNTECAFRVISYVDSQNSFGALLRMNYQVEIHIANGHWWPASFHQG